MVPTAAAACAALGDGGSPAGLILIFKHPSINSQHIQSQVHKQKNQVKCVFVQK